MFLRSRAGTDPVNCLWVVDAAKGDERLVADPADLLAGRGDAATTDDLPAEERLRRERAREAAGGITAFATDDAVTVAAFAVAGRLFVAGIISAARELAVAGPVFDPRPDPRAQRVAYVTGRLLCLGELDGRWDVLVGGDDHEPDTVSWGSADFIAAEEMHRFRGFWWSPDGAALAVTESPHRSGDGGWPTPPPAAAPTEVAYPAAGTDNAVVTLHVVRLDGTGSRCAGIVTSCRTWPKCSGRSTG